MKRFNVAWIEGIIIGLALGALMVSLGKGCGIETARLEAIGSEG